MPSEINSQNNPEIEEALKEFENKESQVKIVKAEQSLTGESKMVWGLMKHSGGLIKEKRQAEYFLLGFSLFAILVSLFMFFSRGNKEVPESPVLNPRSTNPLYP